MRWRSLSFSPNATHTVFFLTFPIIFMRRKYPTIDDCLNGCLHNDSGSTAGRMIMHSDLRDRGTDSSPTTALADSGEHGCARILI